MLTVKDEAIIAEHDLERVFGCFWNAALWPQLTPHVKRIQMLEESSRRQRFLMTVESQGVEHTVESLREAEPPFQITYQQSRPPAFLQEHRGEWYFARADGGTQVTLVHRAVLDMARAQEVFGAPSPEEARERVASALRANGRKTLDAIQAHLEGRLSASRG